MREINAVYPEAISPLYLATNADDDVVDDDPLTDEDFEDEEIIEERKTKTPRNKWQTRAQAMRLTSWNCKGAFARKHAVIAALKPDVLVLPEAERLDTVTNVIGSAPVRSHEWVGDNQNKGLGVLSYSHHSLRVHDAYDPRHRWILPLEVEGPISSTLFAVWTVPRVVWAGDFNQSTLFDTPSIPCTSHIGERDKTFFLHHNAKKPHHIDYIFAKPELYASGFDFSVGDHQSWSKASDHVPLTFSTSE